MNGGDFNWRSAEGEIGFDISSVFWVYLIFLLLICELWCFDVLAGYMHIFVLCLRLSCTSFDYSGAISLVWTTRGFYLLP